MSATFMYAGAGLAAVLGTTYFMTKDVAAQLHAFGDMPVFSYDNAAKMRLRAALELDGLHPFETLELAPVKNSN